MQHSRLYTNAVFMGFQRAQRNQYSNFALLQIEGVNTKHDTPFYIGKRVAYVYKVNVKKGSNKPALRAITGKIVSSHGQNGVVKARFLHNLPPKAMGQCVRVMLYPSNI